MAKIFRPQTIFLLLPLDILHSSPGNIINKMAAAVDFLACGAKGPQALTDRYRRLAIDYPLLYRLSGLPFRKNDFSRLRRVSFLFYYLSTA